MCWENQPSENRLCVFLHRMTLWTSCSALAILTPIVTQSRNLNSFVHLITTIYIKSLLCTKEYFRYWGEKLKTKQRSHGILILWKGHASDFHRSYSSEYISDYCHNVSNDPCVVKTQGHVLLNFKAATQRRKHCLSILSTTRRFEA